MGIPTGLVSNTWSGSDVHLPDLASLGISSSLMEVFVFSADVRRAKPHPEPFCRALEGLAVRPDDAAFVGDNLEADIRGAKALGMATIWKLNGRRDAPPAEEADHTIHNLREIFTLGVLPETPSREADARPCLD